MNSEQTTAEHADEYLVGHERRGASPLLLPIHQLRLQSEDEEFFSGPELPSWTVFENEILGLGSAAAPAPLHDESCSICFDRYNEDETFAIKLPCRGGHVICRACANAWFNEFTINRCPMCREELFLLEDRAYMDTMDWPQDVEYMALEVPEPYVPFVHHSLFLDRSYNHSHNFWTISRRGHNRPYAADSYILSQWSISPVEEFEAVRAMRGSASGQL